MTLVVDASVACKWFVEEEGSSAAARLLNGDETLLAPDLIVAEVANALWRKRRVGQVSAEQSDEAVAVLPGFFSELAPAARLAARAFEIACDLDHPVYDCLYLALAEQAGARVVSADARLKARVTGTAWSRSLLGLRSVRPAR